MKKYDRNNKTPWTTNFLNYGALIYFSIVSCLSKNKVPYFILDKGCDLLKLETSAREKKN